MVPPAKLPLVPPAKIPFKFAFQQKQYDIVTKIIFVTCLWNLIRRCETKTTKISNRLVRRTFNAVRIEPVQRLEWLGRVEQVIHDEIADW